MPTYPICPAEDLLQLQLNLYELAKYYSTIRYYKYAHGGFDRVKFDLAKTPTFLHSRYAVSEIRLQQKRLMGILVPLGEFQVHVQSTNGALTVLAPRSNLEFAWW